MSTITLRAEHFHHGPGCLRFEGVDELTDGEFGSDDAIVFALLPAGWPESFHQVVFMPDSSDDMYLIDRTVFAYAYQHKALWAHFLRTEDDDEPVIFRILDKGKEAA